MKSIKDKMTQYIKTNLFFVITITFITFFHFYALPGDLFNADQHFWFQRTVNFIKAIKSAEFKDTFQNPKPGVTVMILSGLSLETFWIIYETVFGFRPLIYTYDTYGYIDFAVKAPLVLVALFSMLIFYNFLKPIFGEKVTLIALIFFGLSPYYTAVNRLFHGDGTMNAFFVISVVLLIKYFQNLQTKYLIFSGISGGAAFLAKSQAVFLIPFIFLISGLSFLILKNKLGNSIKTIIIWLLTFFATIYILFPAMWATPIKTFWKIFDEGLTVASEGRNFENGNNDLLFYFDSLLLTTNTIFLLTSLLGIMLFIYKSSSIYKNSKLEFFSYLSFLCIIVFYFTQMTIVIQKSDRYISILVPFLAIFSGFIISKIILEFKLLFSLILINSLIYISYFSPNYLALYERDNWGSMSKEAVEYLNKKENPENLNVVVTPKNHTFRPFFKGKVYNPSETIPKDRMADYAIVGYKENLPKKLTHCIFEKDIEFRGKLFWKIYNCQ
jgi:hypothetical protein